MKITVNLRLVYIILDIFGYVSLYTLQDENVAVTSGVDEREAPKRPKG